MTPRPRTVTDEEILGATGKAMSRVGPARLTLADIAKEVGLSPATLVQRFGSKRGLLLALAQSAVDSVDLCFEAVRAAHPTPLARLLAAATEMTRYVDTPEEMANHLAYLQIDLSDPDFHRLMLENSKRITAGYVALLDEAVEAGELAPCDTARLARAVVAMSGGSLISWAVYREGTAESFVRTDLDTLLAPYRNKLAAVKSPQTGKAGSHRISGRAGGRQPRRRARSRRSTRDRVR
jgi:AcrR family transcriptional regulator